MSLKEEILEGLKPLFERAEREGLWFRSHYQGITFSPHELRKEHAKGSFLWGACNWELIEPKVLMKDEAIEAAKVKQHNDEILARMRQ